MRILLTNDDGIHAEGLAVLERIARTLSDDVWIVAPETDQSGLSHSLTLFHPLRLALTGRDTGPELAALLPLIGSARVLARLSPRPGWSDPGSARA